MSEPTGGDTDLRWCPSCRKAWPAGTAACRDCQLDYFELPYRPASGRALSR